MDDFTALRAIFALVNLALIAVSAFFGVYAARLFMRRAAFMARERLLREGFPEPHPERHRYRWGANLFLTHGIEPNRPSLIQVFLCAALSLAFLGAPHLFFSQLQDFSVWLLFGGIGGMSGMSGLSDLIQQAPR